jgi:Tol biopolymer transport system component
VPNVVTGRATRLHENREGIGTAQQLATRTISHHKGRFIMKRIILFLLFAAAVSSAQLKVASIEKLSLPSGQEWSSPVFSPDGKAVYFTNTAYDGIWKYTRSDNSVTALTLDPKSGYGFSVSSDGSQIAYRRTTYDGQTHERFQEAVVMNLATLSTRVAASGSDVTVPAFIGNDIMYSVQGTTQLPKLAKSAALDVELLGIENTKIALVKNGAKVLLDPAGNGSYIWPVLSPDKQKIVAYDMEHGTLICDLNGTVLARLGRRDGAVWTRDGKWLVYMNDKDDGRQFLGSEICAVSADGTQSVALTSTSGVLEMNPSCSPVENKIVCNGNGAIYVISYEEAN